MQDRAVKISSSLALLYTRELDPKDVTEDIMSWGPELVELLTRNQHRLTLSSLAEPLTLPDISPNGAAGSETKPSPADTPSFPDVQQKSVRRGRPGKKGESEDMAH